MTNKKDLIKAAIPLPAMMIGAGIFGIPYVFANAGLAIAGTFFIVLAGLTVLLNLMYGEVVERTRDSHRLTGYSEIYYGKKAKDVITLTISASVYGALVAYLILAGEFLGTLFQHVELPSVAWIALFWAVVSLGIIRGIKTVAKIESLLFGFLLAVFAVIVFPGFAKIDVANFSYIDLSNFFLPYGVILFSLGGFQAIPEIHSIIKKDGSKLFRNAIITGVAIAAIVTFIFGVVIVGVSGLNTSETAISGLEPYLGSAVIYVGALFGLIAVTTSYLMFGVNLKESFMYDWKIRESISGLLVVVIPLLVILLGARSFITVAGIMGAVWAAVNGTMITLLFVKAKKKGEFVPSYNLKVPNIVVFAAMVALIAGGIYETIRVVLN
ncbi:MAG: aromatic amino acid transport family protein [Candidatus Spechtbacterales bacterium]